MTVEVKSRRRRPSHADLADPDVKAAANRSARSLEMFAAKASLLSP